MASSWLDRVIADNLGDALVWRNSKGHVKIEPGTEPSQHPLYTDNGSSLKVRVTMPSAVLQVLKVQGQTFTLTDGVVSIQAKVANTTTQRFENQHSSPISSIKNKSIIVSSCDITATHLGPPASHVQLIILGLTISSASLDLSDVSAVTPIHRFSAVRDFLQRLYQLSNPPTERAAPTPESVTVDKSADVEMSEAPSSATKSAEKVNPMKRPHSSPSRSSSHRLVRPRTHEGDDDVVLQKGVNLHRPVHASTNSSNQSDLLRNVLSRNRLPSAGSASSSTAIEQALRLGAGMTAQMGPPPVPIARTNDDQSQTRLHSLSQSQSLSQNFQSQIPITEPAALGSVVADTGSQVVHGSQHSREDPDLNIPKVGLPNNTPTSAQPESAEVLQSSLPRGDLPPPSQPAQAPSTSMDTSSSHLLDDPSSGIQRSMHRAPPPMLIKYASRPIPVNQKRLLEKPTSWWPARPGTTFPHPNLPIEIIQEMEEYAEQRAARKKAKREEVMKEEREREREREMERERTRKRLENAPPTQNTQSSALPWSSSPPAPGPSRYSMQTHRRSTNLEVPLPPDSSAEDPMEVDEPEEEIPSSPPSGSLSDDNDASDIDESLNITPKPNLRQLPEYPLSSPEESSSGHNPVLPPGGSQPTRNVQENSGVQSQDQAIRKHPPIVDEDVPSPEMRANPSVIDQPQVGDDNVVEDPPQVEVDKVMEDPPQVEDDNIMDDQPQFNVGQIMEDEPQVEVAASPQSQSKLQPPRRRRRWGLEGSAETTEERQARNRREFMERFRQNLQTSHAQEATSVPHTDSQANSEVQKQPEMPTSERQPVIDPMEVDKPLIDSTRSVDPTVAKRISITKQWRRQSHQQEGHTEAGAPNAVVSRPIVSEPTTVEPIAPDSILSGPVASVVNEFIGPDPVVPVSAGRGVAVSESAASESVVSGFNEAGLREQNTPHSEILASVRTQPSHQPTESNLPPSIQDDQMSKSEPQSRAERQRPIPSVRSNKAPTYKSEQEASSGLRLENRKGIERREFGEPTRALRVGSLPADINDKKVREMFTDFNPVLVAANTQSAFVNFADVETACKALEMVHGCFLHNEKIVCTFTTPREYSDNYVPSSAVSRDPLLPSRPPAHDLRPSSETRQSRQNDTLLLSLTMEDLFREFSKKRKFKGNRKAFENLCRKLHGAPTLIPLAQWDNYVVLQPAQYVPYVNRSVSNGEVFDDYDTYWNEHLQATPPDLIPILTPAKLEAAFKNGHGSQSPVSKSRPQSPAIRPGIDTPASRSGIDTPASRSSALVSPRAISGATRPRPSPAQRTSSAAPASTPRKAPVPEDLRRSVVERNAQNMISRPQSAAPEAANSIMGIPEPRRASVWLENTVSTKLGFKVVQSDLYNMYKGTFKAGKLQLLNGKLFSDLVLSTFPVLKTIKDTDDKGEFTFYFDGLCFKQSSHSTPTPTRLPTPSDANTPGFRIKGASVSSSGQMPNRSGYFTPSGGFTRQDRDGNLLEERDERSRRSLPFTGEQQRSRPPPSSSTPRNPSSKGTPKGKPYPSDHLPTREVFESLVLDGPRISANILIHRNIKGL